MKQNRKLERLERILLEKINRGKWYTLMVKNGDKKSDEEIVESFCQEHKIIPSNLYIVPGLSTIVLPIDRKVQAPKKSSHRVFNIRGKAIAAFSKKEREILNKFGFTVKFKL